MRNYRSFLIKSKGNTISPKGGTQNKVQKAKEVVFSQRKRAIYNPERKVQKETQTIQKSRTDIGLIYSYVDKDRKFKRIRA